MISQYAWPLVWGVFVGLDLTTVPQIGISRPLVAGSVTGLAMGDLTGGLLAGAVLELFALDFLPVGATRYPDYGLGAIAATAVMVNSPALLSLGLAVFVGLVVAYLGGRSIHLVRSANTADVVRKARELDSGSDSAVVALHARGVARDSLRCLLLTAIGLGLAETARSVVMLTTRAAMIATIVAVGAALAASVGGAINVAGRRPGLIRYVIGLVVGIVWVVAA